jgi:hypothetical protein
MNNVSGWQWFKSRYLPATENYLKKVGEQILMKLSEIKKLVADAAGKSSEAFAEIGTRLADMQKQIDELIAGNADPDVTDEAFTADLAKLKTTTDALADIVPTPQEPPVA